MRHPEITAVLKQWSQDGLSYLITTMYSLFMTPILTNGYLKYRESEIIMP